MENLRYADGQIDSRRNSYYCVREDHTVAGEAINTIVRIDLDDGNAVAIVVSGNDFYSSPRLSPDGSRLRLADLESSQHAVGRHRAVGRRIDTATAP